MDINPGANSTMAPGGSARHPGLYGPSSGTALGHHHGHRSRSWASIWPLEVTQATDTNTDSGCSRTTCLDMVLGSSLGPDVIMAFLGITGHPYRHGLSDCVDPDCQHVFRHLLDVRWYEESQISTQTTAVVGPQTQTWSLDTVRSRWHMALGGSIGYPILYGPRGSLTLKYGFRLQTSALPLGVTGETDIATDSPPQLCQGLRSTAQAQTSALTWVASRPFMSACSSPTLPLQIHLSPHPMNHCAFLSHLLTLYLLSIMVLNCLAPFVAVSSCPSQRVCHSAVAVLLLRAQA